jgi:hypothetical protein
MGKRLALVLLEQQDGNGHCAPLDSPPADWPVVPAVFSPWDLFQTLAETWMRLTASLWSWFGTPLLRGV